MRTEDEPLDDTENRVKIITECLEPEDASHAKRRLLSEYDRIQHGRHQQKWQLPAALAAGIVVGILGMQLVQTEQPDAIAPSYTQPLSSHTQSFEDSSPSGQHAIPLSMESANEGIWIETIKAKLDAGDIAGAQVLLSEYRRRFPEKPSFE